MQCPETEFTVERSFFHFLSLFFFWSFNSCRRYCPFLHPASFTSTSFSSPLTTQAVSDTHTSQNTTNLLLLDENTDCRWYAPSDRHVSCRRKVHLRSIPLCSRSITPTKKKFKKKRETCYARTRGWRAYCYIFVSHLLIIRL